MHQKWFEDFEYEFQRNLPPGKGVAASKLQPWGKDVKHRPKMEFLMELFTLHFSLNLL